MTNKEIKIEKAIKSTEGTLKHEGMYLTEEERNLLKKYAYGEISMKEYIDTVIKDPN